MRGMFNLILGPVGGRRWYALRFITSAIPTGPQPSLGKGRRRQLELRVRVWFSARRFSAMARSPIDSTASGFVALCKPAGCKILAALFPMTAETSIFRPSLFFRCYRRGLPCSARGSSLLSN